MNDKEKERAHGIGEAYRKFQQSLISIPEIADLIKEEKQRIGKKGSELRFEWYKNGNNGSKGSVTGVTIFYGKKCMHQTKVFSTDSFVVWKIGNSRIVSNKTKISVNRAAVDFLKTINSLS